MHEPEFATELHERDARARHGLDVPPREYAELRLAELRRERQRAHPQLAGITAMSKADIPIRLVGDGLDLAIAVHVRGEAVRVARSFECGGRPPLGIDGKVLEAPVVAHRLVANHVPVAWVRVVAEHVERARRRTAARETLESNQGSRCRGTSEGTTASVHDHPYFCAAR